MNFSTFPLDYGVVSFTGFSLSRSAVGIGKFRRKTQMLRWKFAAKTKQDVGHRDKYWTLGKCEKKYSTFEWDRIWTFHRDFRFIYLYIYIHTYILKYPAFFECDLQLYNCLSDIETSVLNEFKLIILSFQCCDYLSRPFAQNLHFNLILKICIRTRFFIRCGATVRLRSACSPCIWDSSFRHASTVFCTR